MSNTIPTNDPRDAIRRPGDVWVSVTKPLTGMGATKIRANREFLFFERGMVRTDAQQIPLAQIRDVDAAQTMTQKVRGVGNIRVHVDRGQAVETVLLEDVPDFRHGVEVLNGLAREARAYEARVRNTQHLHHQGAPQPKQPPAAPAGEDVFEQLRKLGEMRDAGWVSVEEFEAKKSELLRRI